MIFFKKHTTYLLTCVLTIFILSGNVSAQDGTRVESTSDTLLTDQATQQTTDQTQQAEAFNQLSEIQNSLDSKIAERRQLRIEIQNQGDDADQSLQTDLAQSNSEIEVLNKTFEQIAIGGVDLSVFGVEEKPFDWREELILVVQPLIENIKGLTEKPRKIESLRRIVSDKTNAKEASTEALASIQQLITEAESQAVIDKLSAIEKQWASRLQDIQREIQLANFQLDNLEGKNVPWHVTFKTGALDFVSGRGFTLALLLIVVLAVWGLMRGILWLIQKRSSQTQERSIKVRYRLANYAYRLLTILLMAISIMVVLYMRQDLLLLAIMVILFVGAALALKNLLPKYIAESRLLLNMGSVRESERVMYNGLPWKVNAINMYSRFTNPEIRGDIRMPIHQMYDMISRPAYGDPWFPSSENDWILVDDKPMQVIRQAVDVVLLEDLNSVTHTVPSADYYASGYPNLSRAEGFRIAVIFGIDYATQSENVEKIEDTFKQGVQSALQAAPYANEVTSVNVEFHSAGDSSLNYVVLTRFLPAAAGGYNRIKRRIQRACVMVCNENNWGIPFPQLSVHIAEPDKDKSAL